MPEKAGLWVSPRGEPLGLGDDVREFLGETVMQVTGNSAPLVEDRALSGSPLVRADLARRSDEEEQVEANPEDVARVDPV
jgi:hypothetical protein